MTSARRLKARFKRYKDLIVEPRLLAEGCEIETEPGRYLLIELYDQAQPGPDRFWISTHDTTDGAVTIVVKKKFADDTFIARFCEIQFGRLYKRVTDWTRPALPFSFETDVQSTWVPSKKTT